MTELPSYATLYPNIDFRRRDDVLEMRLHTDQGPLQWGATPGSVHAQLGDAFYRVGRDTGHHAVILRGTGTAFCASMNMAEIPSSDERGLWQRITQEGRDLLLNLLDIPVPMIAAVHGPAYIHAELPLLCDVVLASRTAEFADLAHFTQCVVPGDGAHVVWPALLGPNRGRSFLLTGQRIGAEEALRLGLVAQVLDDDMLVERTWEVARDIAAKPAAVVRGTRGLLTAPIKRRLLRDLNSGLALEGLAFATP